MGCVPPTAVAIWGGLHQAPPDQAPPHTRHPPEAGTPQTRPGTPPGSRHTTPPPRGQTYACKHITLSQTSFAFGRNEYLGFTILHKACQRDINSAQHSNRCHILVEKLLRPKLWIHTLSGGELDLSALHTNTWLE